MDQRKVIGHVARCMFFIVALTLQANAVELKALIPMGMKSAFSEFIPQFEQSSGNKVSIEYGALDAMTNRLKSGESGDVAILTDDEVNELQIEAKIVSGSQRGIARVGVGAMVRKGAMKPNIGTTDELKSALLAAKSIVYVDPAKRGVSGIVLSHVVEQLGIASELKTKTKLVTPGAQEATLANGDADLGFDQISVIFGAANVDYAGPLPADLQSYTNYSAGIVAASTQRDAATDLLDFLSSPKVLDIMKTKGFDPR